MILKHWSAIYPLEPMPSWSKDREFAVPSKLTCMTVGMYLENANFTALGPVAL